MVISRSGIIIGNMILSRYDNLVIQYDEALALLRFQWRNPYSLEHYRDAIGYTDTLMRDCRIKRVITDMRGLPTLTMADQMWLATSWFPRVVRRELEFGALIVLDNHLYNQMVAESVIFVSKAFIKFDLQYFSDVPSALDWVTQSAATVPALQQEWEQAYGLDESR